MGKAVFLLWFGLVMSLAVLLLSGLLLHSVPPAALPEEDVKDMAAAYFSSSSSSAPQEGEEEYVDQPLVGKVVLVTGASSGVGGSLAYHMYKMGATVIVTSRSQEKSEKVVSDFKLDFPFSDGALHPRELDLSDFDSVQRLAQWVTDTFQELHFLVNNAGINYRMQNMKPTPEHPLRSKQRRDLLFDSNYLGHFLLTELLLPLLRRTPRARVLQVSSSSQLLAPHDDLDTSGGNLSPGASRALFIRSLEDHQRESEDAVDVHQRKRWEDAYGVSKLAQIMHAVELQRLLDMDDTTDLKVLSFTPGVTYTGMVPEQVSKAVAERVLYSPDASTYAAFAGMFSRDEKGGDSFWSNAPIFIEATAIGRWMVKASLDATDPRLQKMWRGVIFPSMIFFQQYHYGELTKTSVNPACADKSLTEGLYSWSKAQVSGYSVESSMGDANKSED